MLITKLQHINIRTTKFDESVTFYRNILGLKNAVPPGAREGARPSWLYDDSGEPIVHLLSVDPADPEGSYARMTAFRGGPDKDVPYGFIGSGSIDHVALACEDWDEVIARLKRHNVPFRENHIPNMNTRQLFIRDPNGIMLELNFQPQPVSRN